LAAIALVPATGNEAVISLPRSSMTSLNLADSAS
jgi:hypothetical protein